MKKHNNSVLWMIPLYFFIFLCLFISFKFIFIFFFRAAFEPRFIFELTPFYILLGVNNLQLLFLSLIVVFYDTYLHIKATRKNLKYSFIPTSIMLCGLGLAITTKEISVSNLPYYLLFGLLLSVILIDHRRTLIYPETLPSAEPVKPEPLPSRGRIPFFARPKPKLSIPIISSLFSIFKRGKKTGEPEMEGETSEVPEPVSPEAAEKEDVKIDELLTETPEKEVSGEPEVEDEISEVSEPVSPEAKEKEEEDVHLGGGPSEPSGGTISGELPEFEAKDTTVAPSEPSAVEQTDKDLDKDLLENVERIYPKEEITVEDQKELEKKKIGLTAEKPMIPKEETKILREKLADRQREIKNKTQDIKSGFENIQGGLESLKNELENISGELQSTVQELAVPRRKREETKPPSRYMADSRKTIREEIVKPATEIHGWRLEDKRKSNLRRAQAILEELDKKVEKLERIYIYQTD